MSGNIPSHLKPGKSIGRYGSTFTIISVKEEENGTFSWLEITAKWTGFGLRPLFADDEKKFLVYRRRILTGEFV